MAEVRTVDNIPAGAVAWTGQPLTPGCSVAAGFPDLWAVSGWCLTHSACGTGPVLSGQVACHPAGFRASGLGVRRGGGGLRPKARAVHGGTTQKGDASFVAITIMITVAIADC